LLSTKSVESTAMADLFVTISLGYPGTSLVPSELNCELGSARINQWLQNEQQR
jgi:hypothetical protein